MKMRLRATLVFLQAFCLFILHKQQTVSSDSVKVIDEFWSFIVAICWKYMGAITLIICQYDKYAICIISLLTSCLRQSTFVKNILCPSRANKFT